MKSFVLDDLCAIVGYSATRTLTVWFRGRYLCVPREFRESLPLNSLIGAAATARLVKQAAGDRFFVPRVPDDSGSLLRMRSLAEALAAGHDLAAAAERAGLSRWRAYRVQKQLEDSGWLTWAENARRGDRPQIFWERAGFPSDPPPPSEAERALTDWVARRPVG